MHGGEAVVHKVFLLFLPFILDPRELKGVKTKGGVWFRGSPIAPPNPTIKPLNYT